MTAAVRLKVKSRPIEDADLAGVAERLAREFPARPLSYWMAALDRMRRRPQFENYPRYGLLLECEGQVVGVLLQIFFRRGEGDRSAVYCNLSSWCIDPQFRSYAIALNSAATARKEVTYLNVSPAPHTRKSIEALGFRRYCDGQFVCLPWLAWPNRSGVRIVDSSSDRPETSLLPKHERDILAEHAALGCRSLIAATDGRAHPFIFAKRRILRRTIPCEQLIYCRDLAEFVAFASPLGRYLLARGVFICVTDANTPLSGLVGRYLPDNGPKYFKGPATPRLGDLSFTELTILGP
jgi:hypothetical protein